MHQNKIKEFRAKTKLTQNHMADVLNISQNAYCLIENGTTRLVDTERINIIATTLNASPIELGLLDGLGIIQNFNDKVENGYIQNLYADNKELTQSLKEELQIKNKQIQQIMEQMQKMIEILLKK